MVKTVGPAVGSKGQIGFKEEPEWGYPTSPPDKFFEFTSEGLVSEYTNLVSASLRADRAIHKQRIGTETAGGDINFEITPEGMGTMFKHALGQKRTKRNDVAFVIVYDGADADRVIQIESNVIKSLGTTGGDNGVTTITSGMTLQQLITAIDTWTNHSCYAPWGDGTTGVGGGYFAQAITTKTSSSHTLADSDYDKTVLARTAAGVTNMEADFSNMAIASDATDGNQTVYFPVYLKYGIYEHTLDAAATVPQGLTFEIGRDVAAFNYYGGRVNSLAMTVNPGEIITGTANVMFKGASTVGDPAVEGTNTGWVAPVCDLRYNGSLASAEFELDIDGTREMFYFSEGELALEEIIYHFTLERDYIDHDGYFWKTTTVAGLLEFMEYESTYFDVERKAGYDPEALSTSLTDVTSAALSKTVDTEVTLAENASIMPLFRGNYIGTDSGDSSTFYVDITTGGDCDGTAAFKGSSDNASWSTDAQAITAGVWYDINDDSDADTGFDIMFPENVTLTVDDTWSFTTFKDENSDASYETEDPLTGFQGDVTFNKGDGSGAVAQTVMGLSFTLNNNLFGDKFELGDRQRAALVPQRRTTEGTLNMEFDDLDIFRMFVNGTAGDLTVTITSDEYVPDEDGTDTTTKMSIQLRFPNLKFSGTTPVIGGEELIVTDFPFTALYDDTEDIPDMRIVMVNGQSYI